MSIGKPEGLAQSLHSCLSTPLVTYVGDVATDESSRGSVLLRQFRSEAAEPGCGQAGVQSSPGNRLPPRPAEIDGKSSPCGNTGYAG